MTVTEQTSFEIEVLSADKPVVVYFWATWCQSCKLMTPQMEALSKETGDKYSIVKVDIGANPDLADKYEIMSTPTLLLFKPGQGKPTDIQSGFAAKDWVADIIAKHL